MTSLTRHHHWDARLAAFLHSRARAPFRWGAHDCCLFAADAVEAMTGTDIADDFRGRYNTESGGFLAIRRVTGGSGVPAALTHVAERHGMEELASFLFAQRGDLLLVNDTGREIAGVVGLHGEAVCAGETGLHRLPLASAVKAWRV